MSQQDELREPLLAGEEEAPPAEEETSAPQSCCANASSDGAPDGAGDGEEEESDEPFTIRKEMWEMWMLGFPLAVSFFCRMGMASTDSAFVGHINDGVNSAGTYLAAAVLSDMCASLFLAPPLAFNQVLNALVGQAMGSGNPKMAGIWLQQSVFWLSTTMLPCLVGLFYVEPFLRFLDFPEDVAKVAGVYAKYNVVWPVPNGVYQCMRFYFQAQGLPRPAMYNNILFLFVNAFLNWTFVMGGPFYYMTGWKGFGFVGAAISLSFSRTLQPVFYFLYMFVYKKHHLRTWPGWSVEHHTSARTWEFLKQSLPNVGTLMFQVLAGQATTVLVGRLGELSIAASSALSTVTIPWSGSLSATCTTIAGVRVGHHLGRGKGSNARQSTWLVLHFISGMTVIMSIFFLIPPLRKRILDVATNDKDVLALGDTLIPAMLVGTYLNLLVGTITSGVFSGMGRPLIATILSFGLELPLSIGGVAIYILVMHGNLLGVYWWQALSGGIELVIVMFILLRSNWQKCADDAQRRQEASPSEDDDDNNEAAPESSTLTAETDEEAGAPESTSV